LNKGNCALTWERVFKAKCTISVKSKHVDKVGISKEGKSVLIYSAWNGVSHSGRLKQQKFIPHSFEDWALSPR
jgi:hypothetical protein